MRLATFRRRLQFSSGPQKHVFYACADCLPELESCRYITCFYAIKGEPVQACTPTEDDIECDLCKEGGNGDDDYWSY